VGVIFRIAIRNVFRNPRRTGFSLAVIALGVAILIFILGFIGGTLEGTKRSLACESGAVQVADPETFRNPGVANEHLLSPVVVSRVLAIIKERPGVIDATWQISFAGLIGVGKKSTLLLGRGIVPCNCVQDYACLVTEGAALPTDASREILLGKRLALRLGVGEGDTVNLATATVGGNFNAASAQVIGTVTYPVAELEEQLGFVSVPFAQRLLKTDGVERVLIGLVNLDAAPAFALDLQVRFDQEGLRVRTRSWQEASSFYESLSTFWSAFSGLAQVGVFVFVLASILEVLTMSFLERTREIGTVRAFGTTRARVFATFLLEGACLGAIGAGLGALLGTGIGLVFNALPITSTPPAGAIPQPVEVQLGLSVILSPMVAAILATAVGALVPSWRTSRKRIVDALHSV
jgi:putative ABC transport system permease protein